MNRCSLHSPELLLEKLELTLALFSTTTPPAQLLGNKGIKFDAQLISIVQPL